LRRADEAEQMWLLKEERPAAMVDKQLRKVQHGKLP
jgi:hypothetical protein